MKIDKKHFPPITILAKEDFDITIPGSLLGEGATLPPLRKFLTCIRPEARNNILLSTKEAESMIRQYEPKCVQDFFKESKGVSCGGCYINMNAPIPLMDLFKFFKGIMYDEFTGEAYDVISVIFARIQDRDNTLVSFGAINFQFDDNKHLIAKPKFICIDDEEEQEIIDQMTFLLSLNCFLKYGNDAAKNIVEIGKFHRKALPDGGGVIDNTSGLSMRCLCAPKGECKKPDK